jgi:hypothetical protein
MASGQCTPNPPAGSYRGERLEHEAAKLKTRVRDCQSARGKAATTPKDDVQIEDTGTPMLSAPSAEFSFQSLDTGEHLLGFEIAFDERDRIRKIPPRASNCRVENDGRGIKQAEIAIELRNRRLDDLRRLSVTAMGTI